MDYTAWIVLDGFVHERVFASVMHKELTYGQAATR
jgi:hypothetical protein